MVGLLAQIIMNLFTSPFTFARRELELEEAEYSVFGVPFDSSETYRGGSREAPAAIREASREVEDYDLLEDFDLLSLRIADIGDVEVSFGNVKETKTRVKETVAEVLSRGVKPVILGGEHTISAFALEGFKKKPFFLSFDAHLDFREDYLGNRYSHACTLKRASEITGKDNVLAVGVRSACREELDAVREEGIKFIPFDECYDIEMLVARLSKMLKGKKVYMSIDMDFFDPKDARGVCNPEPPGIFFFDFILMLAFLGEIDLAGLDITEVAPRYDSYTPILASKIIFKVLAKYHRLKKMV